MLHVELRLEQAHHGHVDRRRRFGAALGASAAAHRLPARSDVSQNAQGERGEPPFFCDLETETFIFDIS